MRGRTATSIDIIGRCEALRRVEHCMGTVFSIDVRLPGVDPGAVDDVFRWLHWVDETFSTYKPDSQISRLSRGEIRLADCVPEVQEILIRCEQLESETSGYFSAYASGRLDPSGLVKGWAGQRASEMLAAAGSRNHCVNGGGDVHCAGFAERGKLWRVGIADPLCHRKVIAVVAGSDLAVATSGDAERGAHIVNPINGSNPSALASVTVVGPNLGTTDAYATAAFAMGQDAPAWIDTMVGYCGFIVFADARQWSSAEFATLQ